MLADFPRKRWTVAEVTRMVEAGLLDEDAPYELIEGELIELSPQGPLHALLTTKLRDRLASACPAGAHVRVQMPVETGLYGLPEPDLSVVRGSPDDYRDHHPTGPDVLLAVEVAVSSGALDRGKAGPYARAGVATYWLLDVRERRLLVHTRPGPGGYGLVTILDESQDVSPPGVGPAWAVRELLG